MRIIDQPVDGEFNRAPRVRPPLPTGEVEIPPPPSMPSPPSTSWWVAALPMLGIVAWIGLGLALSDGNSSSLLYSAPLMLVSVGVSAATFYSQRKSYYKERGERRRAYEEALERILKELEVARSAQQSALRRIDPDVDECLRRALNLDAALWERRPRDDDFLKLRMGIGELATSLTLKRHKPPSVKTPDQEEDLHRRAEELGEEYSTVPDVPVCCDPQEIGVLGIAGSRRRQDDLIRAMIASIATHHSPDEVKLAVFGSVGDEERWSWMRWLPHVHQQVGGVDRMIAFDRAEAKKLAAGFQQEWNRRKLLLSEADRQGSTPMPRYVLLVADPTALKEPAISQVLSAGKKFGAYAIVFSANRQQLPTDTGAFIELVSEHVAKYTVAGEATPSLNFRPDRADRNRLARFSRSLAAIRPHKELDPDILPDSIRLLDLYGISRIEDLPVLDRWEENRDKAEVAGAIGVRAGGHPIVLDLWENVHGPHGLIAGATRSGKSEFLKTLVSALSISYHPHDLNFVLIDFKGGGLTRELRHLPHVVATATNLEKGLPERALKSVKAELVRRERALQGDHIREYQRKYHQGDVAEPIPRMIVIIDEFAELASEKPDMLESLVSAARVGGSLGVHLILATQKPAGVVQGQIWSNSRFRICLRVETPEDSQDMLRRPVAAGLDRPGRAYLQVGDNELFELIQVARSEATYSSGEALVSNQPTIARVQLNGRRELLWPKADLDASSVVSRSRSTDLEVIIRYVQQVSDRENLPPLKGPWLPPLAETIDLWKLRSELHPGGWTGESWLDQPDRSLSPVIGRLDLTEHQKQPILSVDLAAKGHLLIAGAPGSGKTTVLKTLLTSLICDHPPDQVTFYLLDFGGRALDVFEAAPHVGTVLHPGEEEVVERLFTWLLDEQERRTRCLAGAANVQEYLEMNPDESMPAIVVVLDGYGTLAETLGDTIDEVLEGIQRVVRDGHRVGIHAIMTTDLAGAVPVRVTTNMNMRLALQQVDTAEYSVLLGDAPATLPPSFPGRGLWLSDEGILECQVASLTGDKGSPGSAEELRQLLSKMNEHWDGPRPRQIAALPSKVHLSELLGRFMEPGAKAEGDTLEIPVGLDAVRTEITALDLLQDGPHFLIAGQPQSGKTTSLLTILAGLASLYSAREANFYLIDCMEENLRNLANLDQAVEYVAPDGDHTSLLNTLAEKFDEPSDNGPSRPGRAILAIDDYDFLDSHLVRERLHEWARRARKLRFHLLLAASVTEMRIGFDELRNQVLACRSGFLLSDSHDDAQMFGARLPLGSKPLPEGRGFLIRRGQPTLVQWALPIDPADMTEVRGETDQAVQGEHDDD